MNLSLTSALLLLHIGCFLIWNANAINYSQPIKPRKFQSVIAQGFSTNWFKEEKPLLKYKKINIKDVYDEGFRNLRLRSRAEFYDDGHNTKKFAKFLRQLNKVVNHSLKYGVAPIISWIHHEAEANATEEHRKNYISWWKKVAKKLKNKDYRLCFNLFTELGVDKCQNEGDGDCSASLRQNKTAYDTWTKQVVKVIRKTGGNNKKRIILLGSPDKTCKGLKRIPRSIYKKDKYIMAECHHYASGPNKRIGSPKYWSGNGSEEQRKTLQKEIKLANTSKLGLHRVYWGAWLAEDNENGDLNETEVKHFSRFFVSTLKTANVPWSLNVLDRYYDTGAAKWLTGIQNVKGASLNMSAILQVIKDTMA